MIKTLICFALLLVVAGCGKGDHTVGATAGSDRSIGSDQTNSLDRNKTLRQDKVQKLAITQPAIMLIADALRVEGKTRSCAELINLPTDDPKKYLDVMRPALVAALTPVQGWSVDPLAEDASPYVRDLRLCVNFTNEVFSHIATEMQMMGPQSLDMTKNRIIDIYYKMSSSILNNIIQDVLNKSKGKIEINLTGTSGVQFTDGRASYDFTAADGVKVRTAGGEWFGGGYLSGKRFDVAIDNTSTASMGRERRLNEKSNSGLSSKVQADVGVK